LIGHVSVEPGEGEFYLIVRIFTARVRSTRFRNLNRFIGHGCLALFLSRVSLTTESRGAAHHRTWKSVRIDRVGMPVSIAFCEVIADYGLPIPIDLQNSQSVAEQLERRRAIHSGGGVFGGK
jgi:hypothetical protein